MSRSFLNVEDVLADELFIAWFYKKDGSKVNEWELFVNQHPQYQPLIGEAVAFMNKIANQPAPVPVKKMEASLHAMQNRIDGIEETPVVSMTGRSNRRKWLAAAAIAAIIIVSSALFLFNPSPSKDLAYATPYGQLEKHELPDGSVVTLNANSSVKISEEWSDEKDREVWLNGEAFFEVSKTKKKNRFIVHTGELDVIVTGTQFNVVSRNNRTSVFLTEGSVTIRSKDGEEVNMKPGDFVELGSGDQLQKKGASVETVTAWTEKKMMFENTPMEKAAEMIRDIYGVEVELSNQKAKDIILTGVMPNDNLDILLQSIEASMDCKIVKEGNKVIITGKP